MKPHRIYAGTYREAMDFASARGWSPSSWTFVRYVESIMELRYVEVYCVGTYKDRSDWEFFKERARLQDLFLLHPPH